MPEFNAAADTESFVLVPLAPFTSWADIAASFSVNDMRRFLDKNADAATGKMTPAKDRLSDLCAVKIE